MANGMGFHPGALDSCGLANLNSSAGSRAEGLVAWYPAPGSLGLVHNGLEALKCEDLTGEVKSAAQGGGLTCL